jgi:heme exporter protein B
VAIGPDAERLSPLAAAILWAGALLSTLISLDRVFQADFEDGSLDVVIETADILELSVLAKAAAHWLSSCLPLIIAAPVIGLLLSLPAEAYRALAVSLLIGTPALSLIGAIAAALTLALRRANILVAILAAPLYAPVLIFGVGAASDTGFAAPLLYLAALTLLSIVVAPLAAAAAIRFNMA